MKGPPGGRAGSRVGPGLGARGRGMDGLGDSRSEEDCVSVLSVEIVASRMP